MNATSTERNNPALSKEWEAALAAEQNRTKGTTTTRRRGRVIVRMALLGTCLGSGLAASLGVQAALKPPPLHEQPTTEQPTPSEGLDPELPHPDDGAALDTLIRAGCFATALKMCQHPEYSPSGLDHRALAYHEALCLEGLGQWKAATDAYRKAAASESDLAAWARATFGRVRCALAAGDLGEAAELLHEVGERLSHAAPNNPRLVGECLHLRARLALLELGPPPALDPFDPDATAWPEFTRDTERYLDWLDPNMESKEPDWVTRIANRLLTAEVERKAAPDTAARALRVALFAAPDHPTARATRIALANLNYRAGHLDEANAGYRQVLDGSPHSAEAVIAAYNLGLLELRQWNPHAAQARFLEVIDRSPNTRWADYGWWWIARSHLDAGDTGEALRPLRQALDGKTKEVASAAGLGLCACHILDGDDEAARTVLRSHRISTRQSHAALFELFEALLRYRVAPTESRGEALLTALHTADHGRRLGLVGVFLAGQAYRDLGHHERAVGLYDTTSETARGPLAVRMIFEAAKRFDQLELRYEARQRYLIVAVMDPHGLGPKAELRVAELAAREGRGAECVRRCRELIGRPGIELPELLAVMGHGYELLKQYRHAAECFAGRLPAE